MAVTVCGNFESYVKDSKNIFDVMAAAYKIICPFEPRVSMGQDSDLKDIIERFSEQYNMTGALVNLKEELIEWLHKHNNIDISEIKKKLFFLVRLIDIKCVNAGTSSVPDPYIRYFSLNNLFQDEIIIVPRFNNHAINLLSTVISKEEGHRFYGRNYSSTADISGYMHNFIICKRSLIKPRMNIVNYYDEINKEFEQKKHKLRVGIFPLSNVNLNHIFLIEEDVADKEGLFRIKSSVDKQEDQLFERCKEALKICKNYGVDIVAFPEMLFTKKNQEAIIDFVKDNDEDDRRFPWFMWLGSTWAEGENKCMVIDQYGKVVFEQKKYVPYEYRKTDKKNILSGGRKAKKGKKTYQPFLELSLPFAVIFPAIC